MEEMLIIYGKEDEENKIKGYEKYLNDNNFPYYNSIYTITKTNELWVYIIDKNKVSRYTVCGGVETLEKNFPNVTLADFSMHEGDRSYYKYKFVDLAEAYAEDEKLCEDDEKEKKNLEYVKSMNDVDNRAIIVLDENGNSVCVIYFTNNFTEIVNKTLGSKLGNFKMQENYNADATKFKGLLDSQTLTVK